MSGIGRLVIGYRRNDRRRLQLEHEHGVHSVAAGRCIGGCGYDVFFVQSGQDAVRSRDAQVICDDCYQVDRHRIEAEL